MVKRFTDTSFSLLKEPLPVPEYLKIITMYDLNAKSKNDLEALSLQPLSLAHVVVPEPPKPPYHGIPLHIPFYRPYKLPPLLEINPKTKAPVVLNRVHAWLKITGWQQKIANEMKERCIETRTFHKRKFRREFRFRVRAEKRAKSKRERVYVTKQKSLIEMDEDYQEFMSFMDPGPEYLSRLPPPAEPPAPKKDKKPKVKKVKKKKEEDLYHDEDID